MNNEETISKITPPPEIPTMKPIMTIDTIKEKKRDLERSIKNLMDEFMAKTECNINRLDFNSCYDCTGRLIITSVKVEVKI